jgi:uncharacterized protein YegP (UPF0339 family)
VLSKAGKLKFVLDSGPEKMTINAEGVLRWDVPKDFDETKTSVIVTIEDGSKQSILHTFVIHLNDQGKAPSGARPPGNNNLSTDNADSGSFEFQISRDPSGKYHYRLMKGLTEFGRSTRGYDTKDDVKKIIETIQKNAANSKVVE